MKSLKRFDGLNIMLVWDQKSIIHIVAESPPVRGRYRGQKGFTARVRI